MRVVVPEGAAKGEGACCMRRRRASCSIAAACACRFAAAMAADG